jgi:uncharacterized protein YukE
VTGFLAAGWRGRAADSFAEAWADWSDAAADVRDGLAAMVVLLDAVGRDLVTQDDAAAATFRGVSARLADRLG